MYSHELGDASYDLGYSVGGILDSLDYLGGEAGRDSFLLGLALSYDFSEACTGTFEYSANFYESMVTHGLNFNVELKF